MSRIQAPPSPLSRPTALDYFLFFVGCSLSLFLTQISQLAVVAKTTTPVWVKELLLPILPVLVALPQGIVLLWPVFYFNQRMMGRPQALSAGEWLWGVAWLGNVLMVTWTVWARWGSLPDFAQDLEFPPEAIWNVIVVPSMALMAVLIGLISLLARWKQTWTHTFGLTLLVWPIVPLAGLLLWSEKWNWFRRVLFQFPILGDQ